MTAFRYQKVRFKFGPNRETPTSTSSPLDQITVFVGPNNGGKSRALFELRNAFTHEQKFAPKVFDEIDFRRIDLAEYEDKVARFETAPNEDEGNSESYKIVVMQGQRIRYHVPSLHSGISEASRDNPYRQQLYHQFGAPFIRNLDGISRLQLMDPQPGERRGSIATTTINRLLSDNQKREKCREIIFKGFARYLVVDPTGMSTVEYKLSKDLPPEGIEHSLTDDSQRYFTLAQPLRTASDGTKAFCGIICEAIAGSWESIFIDEPEAFLHPALSNLLGFELCRNLSKNTQLFVATHSANFLLGALSSGRSLKVVRLSFDGETGSSRELSVDRLSELSRDPLLRSANTISGLFSKGAIVLEADGDRAFYNEIYFRIAEAEALPSGDIAFLNSQNKQTAATIASFLRSMGVPAAMILDLDWIKEDGVVAEKYFEASNVPESLREGFKLQRRAVRRALEAADPNYKRNGGIDLLSGSDLDAANAFFSSMDGYGLFTVRRGELESWLPQLGLSKNKQGWVGRVFDAMGSDPSDPGYLMPTDDDAFEFVRRAVKWTGE